MLGQDDNERIMGEHLRNWGIAVQWNTELVALEQQAGPRDGHDQGSLTAVLATITATYVAGCDGARSAVREMNGIGVPGRALRTRRSSSPTRKPPVRWSPDELNVYLVARRVPPVLPDERDQSVAGDRHPARRAAGKDDVTFDDLVPRSLQVGGAGLSFTACHWFSTYRIHHRCTRALPRPPLLPARRRRARAQSDGRTGHEHRACRTRTTWRGSWRWSSRIARTTRCSTPTRPSGVRCAPNCSRPPTARSGSSSPRTGLPGCFARSIIPRVAAFAMKRSARTDEQRSMTLSQIGIRYRESPLSQTLADVPESAPQAGDRFPWLRLTFQPTGSARGSVPEARRHAFQSACDRTAGTLHGEPSAWRHAAGSRDSIRYRERQPCFPPHRSPVLRITSYVLTATLGLPGHSSRKPT